MCPHLAFAEAEDVILDKFKKMVHDYYESDKESDEETRVKKRD
jgi:hypothetical protein